MTNEEIAIQLISLYTMARIKNVGTPDHRRAIANAILKLGYQWEDDIQLEASDDL